MDLVRAIGLMSGTSMDGIDVAMIETDGASCIAFGATGFVPYSDADRALLRAALADAAALQYRTARSAVLAAAEAMVTERHGEAVEHFLAEAGLVRSSIHIVGFHGQTVVHRPKLRLTVQIGDGVVLARRLALPVVYDFRAADISAGGEGAPLAPAFHRALVAAAGIRDPVALLNIGGVANVTLVPSADAAPTACDTGPGNALLDDLMLARTGNPIDRDGSTAAQGSVDEAALGALLRHPYFDLPAPKSLDRNAFSRAGVEHLPTADAAATLTAFTAASVARIVPHLPTQPRQLIVCGGGARNKTLMVQLRRRLQFPVTTAQTYGWSADALEAQAFGYLAVRALRGLPLTFPTTTGVSQPTTGGVLVGGLLAASM
jgi:anhydro-N-acetylmuramic acid kinase